MISGDAPLSPVLSLGLALILSTVSRPTLAADSLDPHARETPAQHDARMAWWREARFGMFIHWGVYSVPAGSYNGEKVSGIGEWIMSKAKIPVAKYKGYAGEFNPVKFDADAWVRMAKDAGAKYIVFTSKHHDGFAMFHSAASDWNIQDATPFKRDPLEELAAACRKHGMKLGLYYSQCQDWTHPGGIANNGRWDPAQEGDFLNYVKTIAVPQIREILTRYGDVAVVWWDTGNKMTPAGADLIEPLIGLQPGLIVNNRLGANRKGDFSTPEQHIPATGLGTDWETCMTMNDTWGYRSDDQNWKSPEKLIRNLVDIASKGGNFLLNVGPDSTGEFPQASVERLAAIGRWMKTNSPSIYGTTASPFRNIPWGRCTTKIDGSATTLYLHVFDWPRDGTIHLRGLKNPVESAALLATGGSVETTRTGNDLVLHVPGQALDPVATVIALKITGRPDVDPLLPTEAADGSIRLAAPEAEINNHGYRKQAELTGSGDSAFITNWTEPEAWLGWSFKLVHPGKYIVTAQLADTPPDCKVSIELDGKKLAGTALPESKGDGFQDIDLATIDLPTVGDHQLALRPEKTAWHGTRLRAVTLKPVPGAK